MTTDLIIYIISVFGIFTYVYQDIQNGYVKEAREFMYKSGIVIFIPYVNTLLFLGLLIMNSKR